jgi:hypothetical protein
MHNSIWLAVGGSQDLNCALQHNSSAADRRGSNGLTASLWLVSGGYFRLLKAGKCTSSRHGACDELLDEVEGGRAVFLPGWHDLARRKDEATLFMAGWPELDGEGRNAIDPIGPVGGVACRGDGGYLEQ